MPEDHDYTKEPRWAETWKDVTGGDGTQSMGNKGVVLDRQGKVQFKNDDKLAEEAIKHWTEIRDCLTFERAEVNDDTMELVVPKGDRKPFEMEVLGNKMTISYDSAADCLVGVPVDSGTDGEKIGAARIIPALDDYMMVIALGGMDHTMADMLLSGTHREFCKVWYPEEYCPIQ